MNSGVVEELGRAMKVSFLINLFVMFLELVEIVQPAKYVIAINNNA